MKGWIGSVGVVVGYEMDPHRVMLCERVLLGSLHWRISLPMWCAPLVCPELVVAPHRIIRLRMPLLMDDAGWKRSVEISLPPMKY